MHKTAVSVFKFYGSEDALPHHEEHGAAQGAQQAGSAYYSGVVDFLYYFGVPFNNQSIMAPQTRLKQLLRPLYYM